jgi:hypothetical protein
VGSTPTAILTGGNLLAKPEVHGRLEAIAYTSRHRLL